ncbi:hypothetical protein CAEBREN_08141 [Caenorhabditis brenneri]|uniref:Uncharacterized protein n=1 Tax=Caenorhabditis brenneri TaxID=135651 RepID=G0MN54_CAEBE|nr:hypothetical protein CAEBREN_08141 [Caenorhabditis brenneri]
MHFNTIFTKNIDKSHNGKKKRHRYLQLISSDYRDDLGLWILINVQRRETKTHKECEEVLKDRVDTTGYDKDGVGFW